MRFSAINALTVLSAASLTAASPVAVPAELAPRAFIKEPKTGGVAPRELVVRNTDSAVQKREIVTAIVTFVALAEDISAGGGGGGGSYTPPSGQVVL